MNAKTIALLLALAGAVSVIISQVQPQAQTEFQTWKSQYKMNFASQVQQAYRQKIFLENVAKINAHNSKNSQTYTMGINKFTGMTQEQFVQTYLGTVVQSKNIVSEQNNEITVSVGAVDWVSQGATTPVKDQGSCGSCYAFSATGAMEGLSALQGAKKLQDFSEQQLVDCSGSYGNQGCNGGLMDNCFKFVKAHGIVHQDEYRYTGVKGSCTKTGGDFKVSGYVDITNCNSLVTAIAGRPVSVAVDATNWSSYKSGLFNNCAKSLNHGVLLVGIDSDKNWKVKNSWSKSWGEQGFIRLSSGNTCGICNKASYPKL